MDLGGQRTDDLAQFPNDEGVDILVIGIEVAGLARCDRHRVECGVDARALVGREDSHPLQRAGIGFGADHIGFEQALVEVQRPRVALEQLRGPGFESTSPEFHRPASPESANPPWIDAWTRIGRPVRLMKPAASR